MLKMILWTLKIIKVKPKKEFEIQPDEEISHQNGQQDSQQEDAESVKGILIGKNNIKL